MARLSHQPALDNDTLTQHKRRVAVFKKKATAFMRVSGRKGLAKRPSSQAEVGLLQQVQLARMADAVEGIYDVMRYQVSCSCSSYAFSLRLIC